MKVPYWALYAPGIVSRHIFRHSVPFKQVFVYCRDALPSSNHGDHQIFTMTIARKDNAADMNQDQQEYTVGGRFMRP